MTFLTVSLLIVFGFGASNAALTCKDMSGRNVDWWYVYKLPDINEHPSPHVKIGMGFLYMDGKNKEWQLSKKGLNDTKQAISYTLAQVYKYMGKSYIYHNMYNDHHATGKGDAYRGHTKGVQLFDRNQGYWLIHSVPRFPPVGEYYYPESGTRYGQSMLCVTYKTKDALAEIAEQLYHTQPSIYKSFLPDQLGSEYPRLAEIIHKNKASTREGPQTRKIALKSKGGKEFIHFGKNKKWEHDLYQGLVAPGLKQNLYVETWLNGAGDLPSGCPGNEFTVWNLRAVKPTGIKFTSSKDHSKFAISDNAENPWVCIGDINRQYSQDDRAGGTLCSLDKEIWNQYYQAVDVKEKCTVKEDATCPVKCKKCSCTCKD